MESFKMLVQSEVQVELSWDSPFLQRYPQDSFNRWNHTPSHTQSWHSRLTQVSTLEELRTELNSTSSFISLSWSTVASFCWALGKATIHSIAYVLPATELHRNAMHDSDIYLFVIYF